MFIGEYIHGFDDKNRLSLPVRFRKEMGKRVVITPGLDGCLFVFTLKQWSLIARRLGDASLLSADNRSFNRYLLGGAREVELDSIGRILIPDVLKERAHLTSKAAVVGVESRVEIWNEDAWKAYKAKVETGADQLAEKLSSVGVL